MKIGVRIGKSGKSSQEKVDLRPPIFRIILHSFFRFFCRLTDPKFDSDFEGNNRKPSESKLGPRFRVEKETKKSEKKTKKESIERPQNLIQVLRNTEKTEKKCAERPRDLIQVSRKQRENFLENRVTAPNLIQISDECKSKKTTREIIVSESKSET